MARVAWISAGVSSFLAAYYGDPDRIVYIDVANQHPDSFRFLMDCQKHLDRPIEVLRDIKHGGSVDVCIDKYRYVNGPGGAPCTLHLKKRVRGRAARATGTRYGRTSRRCSTAGRSRRGWLERHASMDASWTS